MMLGAWNTRDAVAPAGETVRPRARAAKFTNNYTAMAKSKSHQPGGDGSAPKSRPDSDTLARGHAEKALAIILKVMTNAKASPQARVAAASALLAHGRNDSVRAMAREHARAALAVLLDLTRDSEATSRTRLAAASALLECGRAEPATGPDAGKGQNRQSWLAEIKEIREQFAVGDAAFGRPGGARTTAETPRLESSSRRTE
jgi:hypothetical protein